MIGLFGVPLRRAPRRVNRSPQLSFSCNSCNSCDSSSLIPAMQGRVHFGQKWSERTHWPLGEEYERPSAIRGPYCGALERVGEDGTANNRGARIKSTPHWPSVASL
jgi:hypothetical protein